MRASVDMPPKDNIHQYQCNSPFIIQLDFISFSGVSNLQNAVLITNVNYTNLRDKDWRDVTALRRHQKQRNVTVIREGIRVSVQYRVSVPISCDIGTLAPRLFIAHFNHLI